MRHPTPFLFLMMLPFIVFGQTPPVPTVTLKWNAVITMVDGTPVPAPATGAPVAVSYNVYGSHAPTGPWSLAGNVTGSSTIRPGVALGLDCYTITAVVKGVESPQVTPICLNVTAAVATVPATPTGFSAIQTQ